MNRNRYILVFDFETDGKDASTTSPVELAAVPIDLRNLEIRENDCFYTKICPDDIDKPDYFELHESTINWHAEQQNKSPEEIVEDWKTGRQERDAWKEFMDYCKDWTTSARYDSLPIPGGQNLRNFDLVIIQRLSEKYATRYPFPRRDVFDLIDMSTYWFLFSKEPPVNFKLETLCGYFNMSTAGSHEALPDTLRTAQILARFLKLFKYVTPKVPLLNGAQHESPVNI